MNSHHQTLNLNNNSGGQPLAPFILEAEFEDLANANQAPAVQTDWIPANCVEQTDALIAQALGQKNCIRYIPIEAIVIERKPLRDEPAEIRAERIEAWKVQLTDCGDDAKVLPPIYVAERENKTYHLIDGEARLLGAKAAGFPKIRCHVVTAHRALESALILRLNTCHGIPLGRNDVSRLTEIFFRNHPQFRDALEAKRTSCRQLGELLGVSKDTISRVTRSLRAELGHREALLAFADSSEKREHTEVARDAASHSPAAIGLPVTGAGPRIASPECALPLRLARRHAKLTEQISVLLGIPPADVHARVHQSLTDYAEKQHQNGLSAGTNSAL